MKRRILRVTSVYLLFSMLLEIVYPTAAWALTGGPSQPEVQSFEPVGTSDMVDLFSGDFVYNIPLLDVDGYPINISYHGGIGMDQEASWVGLGWNINPGVINRNMRGIPDDFDGGKPGNESDVITNTLYTKPNRTYGVTTSLGIEIFGLKKAKAMKAATGSGKASGGINIGIGLQYNNYRGFSMEQSVSANIAVSKSGKGNSAVLGIGVKSSSSEGLTINPSVSFQGKLKNDTYADLSIASGFNSRQGVKAISLGFSNSRSHVMERPPKKKSVEIKNNSNGGSVISFGTQTYAPVPMMPTSSSNVTFSAKVGGTFLGIDGTVNLTGYYAEQKLVTTSSATPAFGYFNSEKASSNPYAMHDFNREKEVAFSMNTPALPLTNYTYDIYSVNGQGVGGMYRPFRSEVGHVFDKSVNSTSDSKSLGLEIAAGNAVKGGADVGITDVTTRSGAWRRGNRAIEHLRFKDHSDKIAGYEKFYFKEAGEKSVDTEVMDSKEAGKKSFFQKVHEFDAVRLDLVERGGLEVGLDNKFVNLAGENSEFNSSLNRENRQKRNQNIHFLTIEEAERLAIDPTPFISEDPSRKISQKAKKHHIGEITALRPDGVRYVYGIPAYNTRQDEVTFAVNPASLGINQETGTVTYASGDDKVDNGNGIDSYYQKTEIPSYAHSYLLTSVLSADYIDNDMTVGPSRGDMGSYTKFNYSKTNDEFKWRVPVGDRSGNLNEGLISVASDDKVNYLYGEKEMWYLESIETKTHIAVFELGARADAMGVTGKSGLVETNSGKAPKLLKKIKLYVTDEYRNNPGTAIPLKTVHFEYDYSLCKKVHNNTNFPATGSTTDSNGFTNQGGKLTLKKIYFTYQNSNKGRFSPYEFTYSASNPDYNPKAYDRWGNYKAIIDNDFRRNIIEPYVEQNQTVADASASAWSLTEIKLPSGGEIKVEYESDDYAYVQDRPAMQMFKVTGISKSANHTTNRGTLYNGFRDHNMALHVALPNGTSESDFKKKYLKGVEHLYFRMAVDMSRNSGKHEMVPGYAKIRTAKVHFNGTSTIGLIELEPSILGEKVARELEINPITKAALQFNRLYTPVHAYDQTEPSEDKNNIEVFLKALVNSDFTKNITSMMLGINGELIARELCSQVDLSRSYVRLLNPDKRKLGGGTRVKSVAINDGWNNLTGMQEEAMEYGQKYEYTTTDTEGNTISSGVASYEPMVGGEENPFRQPVPYGKNARERFLVPNDEYYMEEPLGESFFPSPSVGYSKVTVKSKYPAGVTVNRHGTGSIVHEFYTAKDFPVRTERTDLQVKPKRSPLVLRLLKISQKDFVYASQGFVVELNDMHGKPKAQWAYGEGQSVPVSGIEYKYKRNGNRLVNEADVVDRYGKVHKANIGVDFDMVLDTRDQESQTHSYGLNGNLAAFLAAIFPASVPMILPAYAKEQTRFRSAAVTKVINRYGLVDEVVAHDLGAVASTRNVVYDAETGEVLLTRTSNNYDDPLYAFTYPAHWAYDGMGPAYKNIGLTFQLNFDRGEVSLEQGEIEGVPLHDLFAIGDELMILYNQFEHISEEVREEIKHRFWVVNKIDNKVYVIGGARSNGCKYPLNGLTKFKLVRSGRKNQQILPIGTITSKIDPIRISEDGSRTIDFKTKDYGVLAVSSTEFSESWRIFCNCGYGKGEFYNPYYAGRLGNWRQKKNYTYMTERTQTAPNTVLRKDGIFTSFSPFWNPPAEDKIFWSPNQDDKNWQWVTEITRYDPYGGAPIEDVNPLSIYSGAVNGYNHSRPVSVSTNAKFNELFFDNFEDYDINSCNEDLSKFNNGNSSKLDLKSHSGKKSIKVSKSGADIKLSLGNDCE